MPFKIVRNDITKMRCDAIVNTANTKPIIGSGCDYAVYKAAGKRRLSEYREKNIGEVPEGDVFRHRDSGCRRVISSMRSVRFILMGRMERKKS